MARIGLDEVKRETLLNYENSLSGSRPIIKGDYMVRRSTQTNGGSYALDIYQRNRTTDPWSWDHKQQIVAGGANTYSPEDFNNSGWGTGQAIDLAYIPNAYGSEWWLFVGAPYFNIGSGYKPGKVWYFALNNNNGLFEKINDIYEGESFGHPSGFGTAISAADDHLLISWPFRSRIYYYKKNNYSYNKITYFSPGGYQSNNRPGYFIKLIGNGYGYTASTDSGYNNNGVIQFIKHNTVNDNWDTIKYWRGPVNATYGSSGKLDMSGNQIIIGERNHAVDGLANAGRALIYTFDENTDTWSDAVELKPSDPAEYDSFGSSVAITGDYAIIGATGADHAGNNSGTVYLFIKNKSGNWEQKEKIPRPTNTPVDINSFFGLELLFFTDYRALIFAKPSTYDRRWWEYKLVGVTALEQATAKKNSAISFFKDDLGMQQADIDKMTSEVSVSDSVATISADVKNSIIKTSGGEKDTKQNIKKKRKAFLNILFADNFGASKIKLKAADIGLDETLKDTMGNKPIKENISIVAKNTDTPVVVSTEVSSDTAVYAELDELDDSVKIDVGLADPVTITKTRIENAANEALTAGQVEANAINEITVVADSYANNKYNINGTETPTLYLIKGKTYRFNQTDDSNGGANPHPMKLYLEADKTTEYTTGVTTGGAPGTDGYLEITVANDAPEELHYQCSAHANMGGVFKVVSPSSNAVSPQWTVSVGSDSVVKEEGENVTVNGVTIYIGSMYVDGTNVGINQNGLTDLASTGIPFIQGTTTVAPLDDIRSRRSLVLDNIFYVKNLGATSLTATAAHLGLDKTVGDNVRTNVKVFPANSEINLTNDLDSDEGGYVDLSNVGHYALIEGISQEKIRIQVTQVDPTKKYMVKNSDGTVDVLTTEFENGDKFTIYNKTFYLGGVYTSNLNEGLVVGEMNDLSTLKIRFANVGTTGVQSNITTIDTLSNIRANRHTAIGNLWNENSGVNNFKTKTQDLGLDITVGKPMKNNVVVYKAKSAAVVDLSPTSSIIDKNTGVYADLNENGDYMDFNTGTDGAFRIKVVETNPKKYAIRNTADTLDLFNVRFLDGQWFTFRGVTFYFGGVMTNGTNDGITAADPYVFPINGNPYKLPDENANYCLYADENTFITGVVSQLSEEKQEEMRQWVIEKLGSDTNNGAKLVTDGFFYSNVHVNTTVGELVLDMETKVCNTNNKDVFNVTFKNTRDNTELFKDEHKTTATISWNDNGNSMAVDVDFFENPQIRNGIRMNTVMTKSNPIGLLVEDYEPSLLCVEKSKNKLSMYNTLLNVLREGQRVEGEKLNLQKRGELWTRHKM